MTRVLGGPYFVKISIDERSITHFGTLQRSVLVRFLKQGFCQEFQGGHNDMAELLLFQVLTGESV